MGVERQEIEGALHPAAYPANDRWGYVKALLDPS